jgi:chemotaxis protein methyltransferase CheR
MTYHRPIFAAGSAPDRILTLLEARTGQQLDAGRTWRIDSALQPVLRDRGLATLEDLVTAMATLPALADAVVDALLNQETSFFRDTAVLDMVVQAAADMMTELPGRRLRLWSAACSTGQEPLSLAMLFAERHAANGMVIPELRATDISPAALRHRILYAPQNLIADPIPAGKFDIVLCRNVLMYLSPPLRRLVLERIAGALRPDGLLVLGAGETVIGHSEMLIPSPRYRGLYTLAGGGD